ncbi:TonB-dependent hemoglobin/transferrin/lactoferrin family receptor [Aureimonas fodinaquatilis]|uniref:TonB-dependent hemoglobin/transferrin/lactoferrin family receptor n=1 Tax=Aureimonas fodinaquatilis TaxID=2565783 RepID=A0A5B0DNW3_9HYPH|nr:TonB-dependent hemoglobin/transferrin/lactoferrin family receptor [Aureimonas fodinaquatilis]KAA0968136.1 TonB-dependent hemoglobin/transferrin/lactoferrin family receptor [Aureimonas fodinaquatilis]
MNMQIEPATRSPERRFASRLMMSTCLLALVASGAAGAQENSGTENVQLNEVVVLSTRGEKRLLDVPQTISVIGRAEMDERNVRDIQDLVRYEPGVSVNRTTSITNPWGQLAGFTIRGMSGNRILMTVDGTRVQEQITDGSRDFFDMSNFKRVEIVRGPNSVLWGSDALGGAVMFQTRDPSDLLIGSDKPWALELKGGYDSFDRSFREQATGAYNFGDVSILLSYGRRDSKEARLSNARADGGIWGCSRIDIGCDSLFPADTGVDNGLAKVVWTPNGEHTVKLTGEWFERNTSVDQLYDMSASVTGIPTISSYVSEAYPRDLEMSRKRVALQHEWLVGASWLDSVNWSLSYSPQSRQTDSTQTRLYSNRTQIVNQYRDYSEDFYEADLQLQSSFALGTTQHTLTYGFDGGHTKGDYQGINNTFNSLTGATTTAINQGFSFPRVTTDRADIYLQDDVALFDGRLTVTPGVRLAHYAIDPTGDDSYPGLPGFEPEKQSNTELLTSVGAIYHLTDIYSAYASFGQGFKMPTSQQLFQSSTDLFTGSAIVPNPTLKPESVDAYEAGIRGYYGNAYFSAGVFYSRYKNFIRSFQPTTVTDPSGNVFVAYTFDNVEDVELYGLELAGEVEVTDYTRLQASLSWSRGNQRVASDAAKTFFDAAVPITAIVGVTHQLPDYNLQFEVFGTFAAGKTDASNDALFLPSSYAFFDAYAKWTPRDNFELTLGVENILDKRYFPNTLQGYNKTPASTAVANVNPLELQTGPGRVFKVGATVKF